MKIQHVFVIFILTLNIHAQIQWQNPLPQGDVLLSIYFKDSQNGFAVGLSGTILSTVDGGRNWGIKAKNPDHAYYSIKFIDQNLGFICGADRSQNGILLKTTDGGAIWKTGSARFDSPLFSIETAGTNLYAVGGHGTVLRSIDLGDSWMPRESGTQNDLWSVCFPDGKTGYIAGDDILLKSSDKGETWIELTGVAYPGELKTVWFNDTREGYFMGQGGTVLKTIDGGDSFVSGGIESSSGFNVTSAFFTSRQVGYACGEKGNIFKTLNAGESWIEVWNPVGRPLYSVFFLSATEGFAAGVGGTILHTDNGGDTWSLQSSRSGLSQRLASVFFVNDLVGYAVGGTDPYGPFPEALTTRDGGMTWREMNMGVNVPLNGVFFTGENTGYAVGYEGTIVKTEDGGDTWNPIITRNWQRNLQSVFFVNEKTGFVVGGDEDFSQFNQVVLKTTDAGLHWDEYESDRTFTLNSVHFVDDRIGFACGNNSNLIRTVNGGQTWMVSNTGINEDLRSIFFISAKVGFCAGEDAFIYKTTDGGETWFQQTTGFEGRLEYDLNSIRFVDADRGIAVGGRGWTYDHHGRFEKFGIALVTVDGGDHWMESDCATWNNLNSLSFINRNEFIACGDYCSLIKVTGAIASGTPDVNGGRTRVYFELSQNFPNPFNPITSIHYFLPAAQDVELEILDMHGRLIEILAHGRQAEGHHLVKFDCQSLPSGVYLYSVKAGEFREIKKLTVLR